MNNLLKAKVGDLLEFDVDILKLKRKITMRVLSKNEHEILLDETDVLFTEGYFDDSWEKTELCQLLKRLSNYFPVKAECSILSKEEIEKYYPDPEDRIKYDSDGRIIDYWTKTDAGDYYYFVDVDGKIEKTLNAQAGVSISLKVKLQENDMDFEEAVKQISKELGSMKVSDYFTACFNANEALLIANFDHPRFYELFEAMEAQNNSLAAIKFVQLYNDICKIETKFELTEIDDKSIPDWIAENLERIEKQIYTNQRDDKNKKILDWEQIGEEMFTALKKKFAVIKKYRK